jgi:hypothetical protein
MLYGKKEVHDPINGIKKGYFPHDPLKWAHDTLNGIMNGYLALFLERSMFYILSISCKVNGLSFTLKPANVRNRSTISGLKNEFGPDTL